MKNMVLLIDTNVIIDYILVRQPQFSNSVRVISACQNKVVKGYMAFHSLSTIWYVARKQQSIFDFQYRLGTGKSCSNGGKIRTH